MLFHGDAHSNHSEMSKGRERWILGACSLASLARLMASRFSENTVSKDSIEKIKTPKVDLWSSHVHAQVSTYIHTWVSTSMHTSAQACIYHTYTQREILACYCTAG